MRHQPKGHMCLNCANYDLKKCQALPFSTMPVIDRYHDGAELVMVVKCIEYRKEDK